MRGARRRDADNDGFFEVRRDACLNADGPILAILIVEGMLVGGKIGCEWRRKENERRREMGDFLRCRRIEDLGLRLAPGART